LACLPLATDRIALLRSAVADRLVYDSETRRALLSGIHRKFVALIPVGSIPAIQISTDLGYLNSIERLVDGTIPLEIWLKNAADLLQPFPAESAAIQQVLHELIRCTAGSGAVENPVATLPTIQQRIVEGDDMLNAAFLEAGARATSSVVRVVVPRFENGVPATNPDGSPRRHNGTAWLLASDLLMTNHHVINARNDNEASASDSDLTFQAAASYVEFNFDSENAVPNRVEVERIEGWDRELDFAVLRLSEAVPNAPLRLRAERIDPTSAATSPLALNIIQHPLGLAKKVALRNNYMYDCPYPRIRYFTDTQRGSSGSPVFDDTWRVIALHRATSFVHDVVFQGRPTGWVNEGVQIAAIMDHLHGRLPALHAEVSAAQA